MSGRSRIAGALMGAIVLAAAGGLAQEPPGRAEAMMVRHADGQKTADGWEYGDGLSYPDWSPDGRWVVFTRHLQQYRAERKTWYGMDELWAASADGKTVRPLGRMMKLFWHEGRLIAVQWTEEGGKTVGHFVSVDVADGRKTDLAARPPMPAMTVPWGGRTYAIRDTTCLAECQTDPGRGELEAALRAALRPTGGIVSGVTARHGVLLGAIAHNLPEGGGAIDVWHLPTARPGDWRELIPNASQPALAPDLRTIAFRRDGNLWVARLDKPLPQVDASPIPEKDRPLPGSCLETAKALREKAAFAAVCVAADGRQEQTRRQGEILVSQPFQVAAALWGEAPAGQTIALKYAYMENWYVGDAGHIHERGVEKGQQVIWIIQAVETPGGPGGRTTFTGLKALPDTPANREALRAGPATRPAALTFVKTDRGWRMGE